MYWYERDMYFVASSLSLKVRKSIRDIALTNNIHFKTSKTDYYRIDEIFFLYKNDKNLMPFYVFFFALLLLGRRHVTMVIKKKNPLFQMVASIHKRVMFKCLYRFTMCVSTVKCDVLSTLPYASVAEFKYHN